ncbi:MAG TPA: MbeD/MobD family mobilization/exclusion protein [Caulobacter sp.]|nr:MbeD/MobD family mobilization/exclusion protein [Caulobacter sp.]
MDPELERVLRENAYLKQRCAQLQGDVDNLNSQVTRLTEQLDHKMARRSTPNPLSGGQSD